MSADKPLHLTIDTALDRCAVRLDGADAVVERSEEMARGHGERLFGLIDEVVTAAGARLSDLRMISVSTGPGNFTGARIGVAAARGLAFSTGARAVGVTRFDALGDTAPEDACIALAGVRDRLAVRIWPAGEPVEATAATLGEIIPPDCECFLGDGAVMLTEALGRGEVLHQRGAPELAEIAAAGVTLSRMIPTTARPAPLYLRPPDASVSSRTPLRIL